jgi:hypothetical protein
MKLSLASLCSILSIFKAFHCNAVFTIDFCSAISLDRFVACFTCYFYDRSFQVLLVVRLFRIVPIITSVAIHFTNNLHYKWVRVRVMVWWRRRSVIVWRRRRFSWWWWRCVVVRWWSRFYGRWRRLIDVWRWWRWRRGRWRIVVIRWRRRW